MEAQSAASQECDAVAAWDQQPSEAGQDAALRRRFLITDCGGALGQAHLEARLAAKLARTPDEAYEAAVLLARIDCDAGNHQAELEQARRLVALAPQSTRSLSILWRAARCNGLAPLVKQVEMELRRCTEEEKCGQPAGG